jgi:hypothetical protein
MPISQSRDGNMVHHMVLALRKIEMGRALQKRVEDRQ